MNPRIELLSQSDSGQILALINSIQPNIPWIPEHLSWQYFEHPAGPAKLYGIRNNGELVSFYAAVAQQIRIDGHVVLARMIQDVMTNPGYRGQGYLHLLGEHCLNDIISSEEVGYTFPNEQSEKSFRRLGWHELFRVPFRKKRVGRAASSCGITFSPSSLSNIWDSTSLTVGVHRTIQYLRWRYGKPSTIYFPFSINCGEGLIILKLYNDASQRVTHICDLLTKESTEDLVPGALAFSELFAAEHGACLLTAWLPAGHPYESAFNDAGLYLTESNRYVFVHPGKTRFHRITQPNLWHLTQGDSDIY